MVPGVRRGSRSSGQRKDLLANGEHLAVTKCEHQRARLDSPSGVTWCPDCGAVKFGPSDEFAWMRPKESPTTKEMLTTVPNDEAGR